MPELTVAAIRAAQPRSKKYRLAAGGRLALEVRPNGGKYWHWRYRDPGGREKEISFGVFPKVGLAQARRARDQARALLDQGVDPSAERKARKLARVRSAVNDVKSIGEEWLAKMAPEWSSGYAEKIASRLRKDIWPWLGHRPIADVDAAELLAALQRVSDRGVNETAHRIRRHLSQMWRYAIVTRRARHDPAADLAGALPRLIKHRFPHITDPARIGDLLRAIEGYAGTYVVRAALRMAPRVFVRPAELRAAEWAEFDLDGAMWKIPPLRRKLRKEGKLHGAALMVPLSRQCVSILRDLRPLSGAGRYVFPSARSPTRPMSENTVNAALRGLGFGGELVGHGLRHMASTLLNEQGWNPDAIERQLAHQDRNQVRGIYNQARYMDERRRMMQWWSDYLDALRDGS